MTGCAPRRFLVSIGLCSPYSGFTNRCWFSVDSKYQEYECSFTLLYLRLWLILVLVFVDRFEGIMLK